MSRRIPGVRGQGLAATGADKAKDLLLDLIERYLEGRNPSPARWLLSRADSEIAIRITPKRVMSGDYTQPMSVR
jgi:hypothetical protein